MIRYSKFTAVQEEKLAKMPQAGMPSQPVWRKKASRSLHSAHAKTRRKEGSACPPWQATRLHLHLPNRKRRNRARAMGGRGHPLPSPRAAQIYARIERGNHQIARGGEKQTRAQTERSDGPGATAPGRRNHRPAAEENRSPWRPRGRSLLRRRRRGAAGPPASGPRRRRRAPHPAARPCGG